MPARLVTILRVSCSREPLLIWNGTGEAGCKSNNAKHSTVETRPGEREWKGEISQHANFNGGVAYSIKLCVAGHVTVTAPGKRQNVGSKKIPKMYNQPEKLGHVGLLWFFLDRIEAPLRVETRLNRIWTPRS